MEVDLGALPLSRKQIISIAQSNARINCWTGAIRSGKTVASLLRWLIYVASAPERGELVVVAKTSQTAARNIFSPLQDPYLFGDLASQTQYTAGAPSARILGRRVWVIGANDARSEGRLRGLTCAGALVDEATLVPRDFFTQLLGRMSVPGSKMFLTSNPDNPAHWLRRDFLLRGADLNLAHWQFILDDNPSLAEDYKNAIKAEFTGIWFKRFVLGEWTAGEGAVFDMFDPDVHVADIIPPIVRWLCAAIDYGTSNPTHAVLLGIGADSCLYVVSEWRHDSRLTHRQMTDAEYSGAIRGWLQQVNVPASRRADGSWLQGVVPHYLVIDPSAASLRVQLHRDGMTPVAANNEVLNGIRTVASLLALRKLKIHRSCTALLAEMPGYAWDDRAALHGEDKPLKVDDHGVDALRYAIASTRSIWQSAIPLTVPQAA